MSIPVIAKQGTRLVIVLGALALSASLRAQSREFDIPEGDLKAALETYVAATGRQVIYKIDDVKGRRSPGVKGQLLPEQALERLLAGTSLTMRRDESGAVVVFSGETAAGGAASAVESPAASDSRLNLERVEITGTSISHLSDRNRTGTRTDTDPMELAQSVSTVSREVIAEQQARDLAEVLQNVAGVVRLPSAAPSGYLMRGMEASVLTNGALADSGSTRIERPTIAMQSVEVVRGPESIIGGARAGYGGVVNVITKTADGEKVTEGQVRVGSRRLVAVGADLGGSFTQDKSLNFRLVAERERRGQTSVGYNGSSRDYVAPSVGWENKPTGTSVLLDLVYSDAFSQQAARVFTNTDLSDDLVPIRTGPANSGLIYNERSGSLTLLQRLWTGWSLRWKADGSESRSSSVLGEGFSNSTLWPRVKVELWNSPPSTTRGFANRAELYGEFDSGPVEHRLLVSYDWSRLRSGASSLNVERSFTRDLVTGEVVDTSDDDGLPLTQHFAAVQSIERGVLVQDQWKWDSWSGLVALRHIDTSATEQGSGTERFKKLLPTVGLLYRITPEVSVYASHAKVFRSNSGKRTFEGDLLPPESGTQKEAGIKALLFGKSIAATASVYDLRQRNFADLDPVHGTGEFFILQPEIRSKGGEVEVSGSTSLHWSWRLSAAYNDIRDALGAPVPYRSRAQASGYLRYGFSGKEDGAWAAASATWTKGVSSESVDFPGVIYSARSGVLLNLSLGYDIKQRLSLVIGVRNAFDKRFYQLAGNSVLYPREYTATAAFSF